MLLLWGIRKNLACNFPFLNFFAQILAKYDKFWGILLISGPNRPFFTHFLLKYSSNILVENGNRKFLYGNGKIRYRFHYWIAKSVIHGNRKSVTAAQPLNCSLSWVGRGWAGSISAREVLENYAW